MIEGALLEEGNENQEINLLDDLRFCYPLRRYQKEILELVKTKLANGERELHIVAPPGAGKTIIGLQIISEIKVPSLILCPNTTIQSQWGQKAQLFLPPERAEFGVAELIGNHEDKPLKPITLLTYQVLSTPGAEQEYIEKLAHKEWVDELKQGRGLSLADSEMRILELLQNNSQAYYREISRHASRLRRRLTEVLDLKEVLHANALDLLQSLKRQGVKLVIFDECHHLTDYWAAIMIQLVRKLDKPIVIGLTGTPPEGKSASQETRYLSLVGEIDYQVPTPALVKEGGLAPFQDLVYFTEPTERELEFLSKQHEEFHELITELAGTDTNSVVKTNQDLASDQPPKQTALSAWISYRVRQVLLGDEKVQEREHDQDKESSDRFPVLHEMLLPKENKERAAQMSTPPVAENRKTIKAWQEFAQTHPDLATAFCRYLFKKRLALPKGAEQSEHFRQAPLIDDWMHLLEDFASRSLKTSANKKDHELYERIRAAARKLGYGISEQGLRKQASPVDRVLAFSRSKPLAVAEILDIEYRVLEDKLRAVAITDFEKMSTTGEKIQGVLDQESGGAIATMRTLLASNISAFVNPCLVTGSLLLIDKRIKERFVEEAQKYILNLGFTFKLLVEDEPDQSFCQISAGSANWEPRLYVGMATEIFELGITKCLIGTRGLFGEGWDSQSLNTLIDLTTTTSPVSVKQLRGRAIRLKNNDPLGTRKVANNWDVVCIAPHLEKGLNDYYRFVRKHEEYFGICDDGQIECGVGHVHPFFSEATAVEVFASLEEFNREMIERALVRDKIYDLWKVGEPYLNRLVGCVEVSHLRELDLTPPHIRKDLPYEEHAAELRLELGDIWSEYLVVALSIAFLVATFVVAQWAMLAVVITLLIFFMLVLRRYSTVAKRIRQEICQPNTQESSLLDMAKAVLSSLQMIDIMPRSIDKSSIKITVRSGGTYRVFLADVESEQARYFSMCMKELMAPVTIQPYLIPKYEYSIALDKRGEKLEKAFCKAYLSGKAKPHIAAYHPLPNLIARSHKGREAFEIAWNKYVSPGFILATEKDPELINRYFGLGPSLAQRLLWE